MGMTESTNMRASLSRRLAAEGLGTALLLAAVVGSGIMAERLAGGNAGLALLANTIATAATLVALILTLGPVSGAQFNPAVSLWVYLSGGLPRREATAYVFVQVGGGLAGVLLAHAMFEVALVQASTHARAGAPQLLSEAVATFGLLLTIAGCVRSRPGAVAGAVGLYIAGAYWFTASTSFANPAVTIARSLTNTFAGIRPMDAPGFVAAQLAGTLAATAVTRWLFAQASPEVRS